MYRTSLPSAGVLRNCPVEGCRGGGGFHLWGPNMRSVLPPGARMRVCEAMISRADYLVGSWKAHFLKTVTPKVSSATIVDGALPSFTGRGPQFLYIQDL